MRSHTRKLFIITDIEHGDDPIGGVLAVDETEAYEIALEYFAGRMDPHAINPQPVEGEDDIEYCKENMIND